MKLEQKKDADSTEVAVDTVKPSDTVESSPRQTSFIPENTITYDELPSKGAPYPVGGTITYSPYCYGELLQFNQSDLDRAGKLEFILKGINASFPKDDLAYFDVMFISLLRRLATFDTDAFKATYRCPKCGAKNTVNRKISELEFKDFEFKVPIKADLSPDVDGSLVLEFVPLTIGRYLLLAKKDKETDPLCVQASCVRNRDYEEAHSILYKLYGETRETLDQIDTMLYFGINPITIECTNVIPAEEEVSDSDEPTGKGEDEVCGYKLSIELDDPETLIQPFRLTSGAPGNRVQSRIEAHSRRS